MSTRKVIALSAAAVLTIGLVAGTLTAGDAARPMEGRFAHSPLGRLILGNVGRALTLRSELNVTEEQRAKIQEIVKSHKDGMVPVAQVLKAKKEALRQAVMSDQPDEKAIRAAADELGKAIGDAAVLASRIGGEVRPVFTDEQRQRIEKFLQEREASGDAFLKEWSQTP
ncbi:MAG: Spy/CpxP family protein refolding chaperone [Planctomycetes bacterium]|nr:Spy/CpxP family protein refolding chaperone [Planctomycetota bacterium]